MGYAWQGKCYQDTAQVLEVFARSVPTSNDAGIVTFTASPTISSSGLITWSISHRPLTGTAATTRTGSTQLLACSTPTVEQWPIESIVWVCALFFASVFGFRCGFRG